MKKRVMTFLLAFMLICNMIPETLYAAESIPAGQGESNGGTDIGEESDSEAVMYANEDVTYTVTFDMAGGHTPQGADTVASVEVAEGAQLNESDAPVPVRTGYLFQSWKNEAGDDYSFDTQVQNHMTLTASWTPVTYHVQFDADGGSGTVPEEMVFTYDVEQSLPKCGLTKQGYAFAGWKLDDATTYPDGASVKNLSDQEGAQVVLTAVWTSTIQQYQVQFDANGGTGSMTNQTITCGTPQALKANRYKRTGYSFKGWNTKSDGTGTHYGNSQKVMLSEENGVTVVLYAMWEGYTYYVKYDGNGADSGTMARSTHVYGTASPLSKNAFKKKGYQLAGWSTSKSGTGKVYADEEMVTDLTSTRNRTVTLYARWEKAAAYKITYDCGGGSLPGSAKKSYTIETKTFDLPTPKRAGYDFDGWYTDKNFTNRIGEVKTGSEGDLVLYAKWVKCNGKISKKAAKITSCKATKMNTVSVQAKVKKRVASSDDYYYLVYLNPMNNKVYKMAAKTYKSSKITFTLDTSENQGYVTGKVGIGVKKGKAYKLISNVSYVKNPEKAAENKSAYKAGKTKKGIQYDSDISEVFECNARQMLINISTNDVFDNAKVSYVYNGKTYRFSSMSGYKKIVSECNRKNVNVTVKLLLSRVEGHTDLICKSGRSKKNGNYYLWNVYDNAAREKMEAIFSYFGMIFGQKDCYVSNWILGNEVNNPMTWNYAGNISKDKYFKSYAYAFRALYYGIRSQYAGAHIFICTDHLWNLAESGGYSARETISSFKKHLDSIQKGIKWNLAFHPYSQPLTLTDFWNGADVSNDVNTPFITMKNLSVLTNYIKKNYGSSVRIHLSELGYSSTGSQEKQAAAIAYSYYIAACNPMVDAITIRSYRDHDVEVAQGLSMGIKGKEAFSVFKYMDTAKSEQYTKKYLNVINAGSWNSIVPGYKKSRITKMYRK